MQYTSDANVQWLGSSSVAMVEDPSQREMFGALKSTTHYCGTAKKQAKALLRLQER